MDKISNANIYKSPTLWVEIDDLRIPCAVPTVDLTEQILARASDVTRICTGGHISQEGYDAAFALLAEVLSVNHNFMQYTPDDLKAKRVTVIQLMGILTDWVKFIGDLADQKN